MNIKENRPLVSIAVATYNGGKYLRVQLDTLIAQTYTNLEIIVSDDGSTDGTLTTLIEYAGRYPHFSVYSNAAPHGIKKNFENAIKYCNGTYISFCDQDDVWMPEKIEKLVNNIGNASLIYHNSLFVDYEGNSLDHTFMTKLNCYDGNDCRAFLLCNTVSGHALLFHRKMLKLALPFPDARHHDWWLAFRAAENGGVKYLDEVLVHYRQHPKSETDFLNLKKKKLTKEKIDRDDIDWYETVASAPGKHKKFFEKWVKVYKARNDNFLNWEMFRMLSENMNDVFYMRKKSSMSTFLFILRISWADYVRRGFRKIKNTILFRETKVEDEGKEEEEREKLSNKAL